MSDETTSVEADAVEAAPTAEQVEQERMRAAWAEATPPPIHEQLHPKPPAPPPVPTQAEVTAADRATIEELGGDVEADAAFLLANPNLNELLPEPQTPEDVRRNYRLVQQMKQGVDAVAAFGEQANSSAMGQVFDAVLDGDEPATVHEALTNLIETVGGVDRPEVAEAVEFWRDNDPGAAQDWIAYMSREHQAQQEIEAYQAQQQQLAEQQAAFETQFKSLYANAAALNTAYPDAGAYADEMARLAAESGLQFDPAAPDAHVHLEMLYRGSRALDADAPGTPAWEAQQQANMLNAGRASMQFKNPADEERFNKQYGHTGIRFDGNEFVVAIDNDRMLEAVRSPHDTVPDEHKFAAGLLTEEQELERMRKLWSTPSLRDSHTGKESRNPNIRHGSRMVDQNRNEKGQFAKAERPNGEDFHDFMAAYRRGER